MQEMFCKPKTVEVRVVVNSKKAKVMIRKIVKNSNPEKVKIVFTLKPRFFSGSDTKVAEGSGDTGYTGNTRDTGSSDENFEVQFQKLLRRLSRLDM